MIIKNDNNNAPTTELITQNLKAMHTIEVAECILSYKSNPILAQLAPNHQNQSIRAITPTWNETYLGPASCREVSHTLLLPPHDSPKSHPSPLCPLCKSHDHTASHLLSCQKINTTLNVRDLWDDLVGVAALLQQWTDAQGAAGEGTGVQPDVKLDGVTK